MKPTPLLVAMLMAFGAQTASAQSQQAYDSTNPWYLGVSGGLTHSSNVYKVGEGSTASAGQSNSDMIATASLLGGIDQRFGRQHLTADGTITASRYQRNSMLNNLGYNGRMGLDWYTVNNISGNVTVGGSRQLSSNNVGYGYEPLYEKNVATNLYASAVAHKGVVTEWTLDVGADYQRVSYSNVHYRSLDSNQHDVWIGPSWRPSDRLRLGVDYRRTQGNVPYYAADLGTGQPVPYTFNRDDIDFTGSWIASGASSFDWRLSRGKSKRTTAAGQDSTHTTGQLGWNWRPTGKLSFTAQYVHDTGLQSSFLSIVGYGVGVGGAQDQVINTFRVYGSYQFSGKLSFGANASYSPNSLRILGLHGDPDAVYDGRDYSANLTSTWQYSRGISFTCQAGRQWRTGAAKLYPYTANSIGCSGQILFY